MATDSEFVGSPAITTVEVEPVARRPVDRRGMLRSFGVTFFAVVVLAAFFVAAGVSHFTNPGFFVNIVPPFLPWPLGLVYLSGLAEIALVAFARQAHQWPDDDLAGEHVPAIPMHPMEFAAHFTRERRAR